VLTGTQAASIGRGFAHAVAKSRYRIWACSILPEHVHLVIGRHSYNVETIANLLKGAGTKQLKQEGLHPLAEYADEHGIIPTPWGEKWWQVYLDSAADIERAIRYVEDNPLKERKPRQRWPFVTPYRRFD
jgi:REP element-mobilizing transposase RayT